MSRKCQFHRGNSNRGGRQRQAAENGQSSNLFSRDVFWWSCDVVQRSRVLRWISMVCRINRRAVRFPVALRWLVSRHTCTVMVYLIRKASADRRVADLAISIVLKNSRTLEYQQRPDIHQGAVVCRERRASTPLPLFSSDAASEAAASVWSEQLRRRSYGTGRIRVPDPLRQGGVHSIPPHSRPQTSGWCDPARQ